MKTKKVLVTLLVFTMFFSIVTPVMAATTTTLVAPASVTLQYPDGSKTTVDTRLIDGSNCMMLREALYLFGGGISPYPAGGNNAYKVTAIAESVAFTKNTIRRAQNMEVEYNTTPLYNESGNRLDLGGYYTVFFVSESRNYIPLRAAEHITATYRISDYSQNGSNTTIWLEYKSVSGNKPSTPSIPTSTVEIVSNGLTINGYQPATNRWLKTNSDGSKVYELAFDIPVTLTLRGTDFSISYREKSSDGWRSDNVSGYASRNYRWYSGEITTAKTQPPPQRELDVRDLNYRQESINNDTIAYRLYAISGSKVYVPKYFMDERIIQVDVWDGNGTQTYYPGSDGSLIFTVPTGNTNGDFTLWTGNSKDNQNSSQQPAGSINLNDFGPDSTTNSGNTVCRVYKIGDGNGKTVYIPYNFNGGLLSVDCYSSHYEPGGKDITFTISGRHDDGYSYVSVWSNR